MGAGDRVLVLGRDSLATVVLLFGSAKAGSVYVPINCRLSLAGLAPIVADAEPALAFCDPQCLPVLRQALAHSGQSTRVVSLAEQVGDALAFSDGQPADGVRELAVAAADDAPVVQLYTSGTTGVPKGVMLGDRSFFAIARAQKDVGDDWLGWGEDDVSLLFVPTCHVGGLWWLVRGLAIGSSHVVLPAFEPAEVLRAIGRHRVTLTGMVPAMLRVLLSEPDCESHDFSSLRTLVYGAAPMDSGLLARAREVFQCGFCQLYGMTETGNMAVTLRPEEHWTGPPERMHAAGRALPGVQVRIRTSTGGLAGVGELGEIELRSPARMLGYWKQTGTVSETSGDGFLRTGDGGYLDQEGFVHVCDRIKDMIICGGENVFPAEVERVLAAHPALADVAVIGVPDELWGERVLAFVVVRPACEVSARELLRFARERLIDVKVPRSIEFRSALPRNATGKLLKAELREPYWRGRSRNVN